MARKYPPYGVKRDYPKIEIFDRNSPAISSVLVTTWARTCKEAVAKYCETYNRNPANVRANFKKG